MALCCGHLPRCELEEKLVHLFLQEYSDAFFFSPLTPPPRSLAAGGALLK